MSEVCRSWVLMLARESLQGSAMPLGNRCLRQEVREGAHNAENPARRRFHLSRGGSRAAMRASTSSGSGVSRSMSPSEAAGRQLSEGVRGMPMQRVPFHLQAPGWQARWRPSAGRCLHSGLCSMLLGLKHAPQRHIEVPPSLRPWQVRSKNEKTQRRINSPPLALSGNPENKSARQFTVACAG